VAGGVSVAVAVGKARVGVALGAKMGIHDSPLGDAAIADAADVHKVIQRHIELPGNAQARVTALDHIRRVRGWCAAARLRPPRRR
jgi:hypothetical protein